MPILLSLGRIFTMLGSGAWSFAKTFPSLLTFLGITTVTKNTISTWWGDIQQNEALQKWSGFFAIVIILICYLVLRKK